MLEEEEENSDSIDLWIDCAQLVFVRSRYSQSESHKKNEIRRCSRSIVADRSLKTDELIINTLLQPFSLVTSFCSVLSVCKFVGFALYWNAQTFRIRARNAQIRWHWYFNSRLKTLRMSVCVCVCCLDLTWSIQRAVTFRTFSSKATKWLLLITQFEQFRFFCILHWEMIFLDLKLFLHLLHTNVMNF